MRRMTSAAQAGAAAAVAAGLDFAGLVRRHQAMVYSIGWHFLHDRPLAEELAQEVFLQLHQHRAEIHTEEHAEYWLRKVAARRAIDFLRRRQRQPQVGLDDVPEPASAAPAGADPMLSDRLRRLVASLPEKARMVVVLRYMEDLEPVEIADALGMPVRTVKSHLQRSLALLREKLGRAVGKENV